jgi:hypothetical protein
MKKIIWPNGKKFAFTIVDDTDKTTLENGPIVYDFLSSIGIKSTKTVWIFNGEIREDNIDIIGDTCENSEYLKWVQSLQKSGFEIALHNMSWSNSKRERIILGMELFKNNFGDYPKMLIQHNDTIENESLYWGRQRLSFPVNLLFDLLTLINPKSKNSDIYSGTKKTSSFFWGDICKEKIKYVRNFIFSDINTLKSCPEMPYFDSSKPYVNKWFASTEAPEINSFINVLSKDNILRLENENGCCIIYTHLGKGFVENETLNLEFVNKMQELVKRNGWFAPASEILDYIDAFNKSTKISWYSRFFLELKWLLHKIKVRGTS